MSHKQAKKTVFIHIGTHKTGTTALQSWCLENRESLERKYKIYYPSVFAYTDGHHSFVRQISSEIKQEIPLRNGKTDEKHYSCNDRQLRKMLRLSSRNDCDVILSSEMFTYITKEEEIRRLLDILKGYEIKIVVYFRPIFEWMHSAYHSRNRTFRKNILAPEEFYSQETGGQQNRINSIELVKRWQKVFGENKVIVRPFIKKNLMNGSIVDDFFLSIDRDDINTRDDFFKNLPSSQANVSLTPFRSEILREMNKHSSFAHLPDNQRSKIINRLASSRLIKEPAGVSCFFNRSYAKDLINKYHTEERQLADVYFPKAKDSFLENLEEIKFISDLTARQQRKIKSSIRRYSRKMILIAQLNKKKYKITHIINNVWRGQNKSSGILLNDEK